MLKKKKNKISLIAYLIANGISISRYCYKNILSIAGNCRICLTELKNSIKLIIYSTENKKATSYNNKTLKKKN